MGVHYNEAGQAINDREIQKWMQNHAPEYETPTGLVEGAVAHFDLREPREWDEIWEWALMYHPYDD